MTGLIALGGVSACATAARVPAVVPGQPPVDLAAGSLVGPAGENRAEWSTYLNARRGDRLGYEARYSMSGGPADASTAGAFAARSTLTQQTSTRIASLLDAPLQAQWRGTISQDWAPAADGAAIEARQTTLSWAPAGAAFGLKWDDVPSGAARDRDVSATVRYDMSALSPSLAETGTAAILTGTANDRDSICTLDLSHRRAIGPWQGKAQVTYRSEPRADAAAQEWSLAAQMQRRIAGAVGVTAGWTRAVDEQVNVQVSWAW